MTNFSGFKWLDLLEKEFDKSLMIKIFFKDILKSAFNYFNSVSKVIIKQGSFWIFLLSDKNVIISVLPICQMILLA